MRESDIVIPDPIYLKHESDLDHSGNHVDHSIVDAAHVPEDL